MSDNSALRVSEDDGVEGIAAASDDSPALVDHGKTNNDDVIDLCDNTISNQSSQVPPVIKYGLPTVLIVLLIAVFTGVTALTGEDAAEMSEKDLLPVSAETDFLVENGLILLDASDPVVQVNAPASNALDQLDAEVLRSEMESLSNDVHALQVLTNTLNSRFSTLDVLAASTENNANSINKLDDRLTKDNTRWTTLNKQAQDRLSTVEGDVKALNAQLVRMLSVEAFDYELKSIDRWGSSFTAVISKDGFDRDVRAGDVVGEWEIKRISPPNRVLLLHTRTGDTTTLQR